MVGVIDMSMASVSIMSASIIVCVCINGYFRSAKAKAKSGGWDGER